jgi:hypothetical protein
MANVLTKTYYFEYHSSYYESGTILVYSKPYREKNEDEDGDKVDENEDKNEDKVDKDEDDTSNEATIDAFKIVFKDIKPNKIYLCELHYECDPYVDTFKFYEDNGDGDYDGNGDGDDCYYYGNIIYKTMKKSKDYYSFYQKAFKQVNGCFITEYPYDEETTMRQEEQVDKLKGLPKKVLNHIDDNLDCRYFMIAFDVVGDIIFNKVIYPN